MPAPYHFRLKLEEGSTLRTSALIVERIENQLLDEKRFTRIFSVIGSLPSSASGRQTRGENLAQINFVLPADTEAQGEAAAAQRVREVLALFPQVEAELVLPSVLAVRPPVEIDVFSDNLEALDRAGQLVAEALGIGPAEPGQHGPQGGQLHGVRAAVLAGRGLVHPHRVDLLLVAGPEQVRDPHQLEAALPGVVLEARARDARLELDVLVAGVAQLNGRLLEGREFPLPLAVQVGPLLFEVDARLLASQGRDHLLKLLVLRAGSD